jgi:hypothetical protein
LTAVSLQDVDAPILSGGGHAHFERVLHFSLNHKFSRVSQKPKSIGGGRLDGMAKTNSWIAERANTCRQRDVEYNSRRSEMELQAEISMTPS